MTRVTAIEAGAWPAADAVAFHDAECHGYDADLPVWRTLAAAGPGPVLDIGAGTGRVAIDLAAGGHDVTAADLDPVLLAELDRRAAARRLAVTTVVADAEALPADRLPDAAFGLVLVPMQTIQLLADRPAALAGIRRVLAPGGTAALAIADELVAFSAADGLPLPDPDVVATPDGRRYESQPIAVRVNAAAARIERVRTAIAADGSRTVADDLIELRRLDVATLHAEAQDAGLRPIPGRRIGQTSDHVGSAVVVLRG